MLPGAVLTALIAGAPGPAALDAAVAPPIAPTTATAPAPGSPAQVAAALSASQASLRAAGGDRPGLFGEPADPGDRHAPAG